jgi:hypothetical protein
LAEWFYPFVVLPSELLFVSRCLLELEKLAAEDVLRIGRGTLAVGVLVGERGVLLLGKRGGRVGQVGVFVLLHETERPLDVSVCQRQVLLLLLLRILVLRVHKYLLLEEVAVILEVGLFVVFRGVVFATVAT